MTKYQLWERQVDGVVNFCLRCLDSKSYGEDSYQRIQYVLRTWIGELEKIIGLVLFFGMIHQLKCFLISLITIVSLRIYTGGTHRKTLFGCFMQSWIVFCGISLIIGIVHMNVPARFIVFLWEVLIIILFVPIQSENRIQYNALQRKKFKIKACIVLTIIGVICLAVPEEVSNIIVLSVLEQAMELTIVGALILRKEKDTDVKRSKGKTQ